jgi:uncharacterized hydrophobic protein (TIGR00271 family)
MIHRLQNRIAALLGIAPEHRNAVMEGMLRPTKGDAAGYWLQLVLSVMIATFGLALGSTAFVLGAMLISPLMDPMVELSFGTALGSPLLTFRAAARVAGSIAVAVGGAALITALLPLKEVTAEIASRASPTMLDLFVAAACALAAVYTTVRSSAETTSAAAGTAIGISLVPPLCTTGWGLGTGSFGVARGAALLFTANFTAILIVAALSAIVLGYGQVDMAALETLELDEPRRPRAARTAARWSKKVFKARLSAGPRVLLPLALLAGVYIPLRSALRRVAWQTDAHAQVDAVLAAHAAQVVHQAVDIRYREIRVQLIVVADQAAGRTLADDVRGEIERRTHTRPKVSVIAVPDADALAAVAATAGTPFLPPPVAPPAPPGPRFVAAVRGVLADRWPAPAGELVAVRFDPLRAPAVVELVHVGAELGPAARDLLARDVGARLGVDARLTEIALPLVPAIAAPDAAAAIPWLARASAWLDATAGLPDLAICIEVPPEPARPPPRRGRHPPPPPDPVRAAVMAALEQGVAGRSHATLRDGPAWSLAFASCPARPAPASDGVAPAGVAPARDGGAPLAAPRPPPAP